MMTTTAVTTTTSESEVTSVKREEFPWNPYLEGLLCEAIANGSSMRQAARIVGCNSDQATGKFTRIRKAYGRQGE